MTRPLAYRLRRSERWRERYRTDPEFRLRHLNRNNQFYDRPQVDEMPPVGEAKPQWAKARQRDEEGRFA